MSNLTIDLLILGFLLVCSAFFSGSETALTAASRARMFALMKEGAKRAQLVLDLREKKEILISTLLLGNTFVNIAAASLATIVGTRLAGEEYGAIYATIATTLLVLIFSEVLPKTVAIHHSERFSLIIAPFLNLIIKILWPITWLVQRVVRGVLAIFGVSLENVKSIMSGAEAIRGAIDMHHHEGEMEKDDRDMLGSILDLSDYSIGDIMTHRSQVESIDIGLDPETIIALTIASNHSRIPLWKDNPENIIGVLHFKDLLRLVRAQKIGITREMIRRVAHKPWFVPETTMLDHQLDAFRTQRKHFACVVDEYGAWLGVVTLEDIIEEIVGEIDDEHDPLVIAEIMPFGERAFKVAGTVTIRDINRQLDWDLPDDNAATVAGLVLHEARVIPDVGAVFEFFGYRFTVAEKKVNQITQLLVEHLTDPYDDSQE
jgi:Mg2+/Co2+ transporter CorB